MAGARLVRSEIEQEIDYLLFVDHEQDMKDFTRLRPVVRELAELFVRVSDRAFEEYERNMKLEIAKQLQDSVGGIILQGKKSGIHDW